MHLFMRGDPRLQHGQSDLPFSCFHPTCTIIELLHVRDHYLHDALHRTNYAGQCQSATVLRVLLPRCRTLRKYYPTHVDLSKSVTPSRCLRRCPPRGQSPFSRLRLAVILRPSRSCCAGVSGGTCHVDAPWRWCCVNASWSMSNRCDHVTPSELYVKLLSGALRSRSSFFWTSVRGARRCAGVGRGGVGLRSFCQVANLRKGNVLGKRCVGDACRCCSG